MNETTQGNIDMEQTRERQTIVVGRLEDLGLGNPDGIPSRLADATNEELQQDTERLNQRLVEPNDLSCTACIDGRRCKHNADGSEAKIRLRRVGGSASNLGVALNAESSIVDTLDSDSELSEDIQVIDNLLGGRSAHLGGCGGANGEIADDRAIHDNPAVLGATKAFMSLPVVREYLGVDYSDELGERVRVTAGKTADFLEEKGWDGQAYVDGVASECPANVEDLEVDETDHKYHGHKEATLDIIIGDVTAPLDHDGFVWNLKASKEVATQLAGQRGQEGYQQAIIAEIAKHMAVANRLPSTKTPVRLHVA